MTTPREVRSSSPLHIVLDVGKTDGPAFATVAVVDEGILSLTGFASPDPLAQLFARRALGVETYETIGWTMLHQPAGASSKTGGGDDAPEEFGYYFDFTEPYPRGQESALYMLADVMEPGDWYAAFNEMDSERHAAPTVEGIDFPKFGVRRAQNHSGEGILTVETYAASRSATGTPTSWRVSRLPDAQSVAVELDGRAFGGWRAIDASTIEISCSVASQTFRIRTGWAGAKRANESVPQSTAAAPRRAARSCRRRRSTIASALLFQQGSHSRDARRGRDR